MTTENQFKANRRNARKSTGPKTDNGKAVVRLNALKHGLLSAEAFLPNEDEAALADFGQRLRAQFKPMGDLEELLVDRIVSCTWRLRRVMRVESGLFTDGYYSILASRGRAEIMRSAKIVTKSEPAPNVLSQEERRLGPVKSFFPEAEPTASPWEPRGPKKELIITDEEACQRGLDQVGDANEKRHSDAATLGDAYGAGSDRFAKLSRYEIAIERSLYKALHELQRLQAARSGVTVPPPAVVDVNVDLTTRDE